MLYIYIYIFLIYLYLNADDYFFTKRVHRISPSTPGISSDLRPGMANDNGGNRDLWKLVVLEFRGYENIVLICIPKLIA